MPRSLALAALAAALACSRPQPSPDYARARDRWTVIAAERGIEAPEDPRTPEVLAALARVPPDSADAPAAAELRGRIEAERAAVAAERERRAKLVERAGERPRAAPGGGPAASSTSSSAPGPAGGRDGGPRAELAPGMSVDDFRSRLGDCFERRGAAAVTSDAGAAARPGEVWALRDDAACRARHPETIGQLAVFAGGVLTGLAPEGSGRQVERREVVELGKLADGGVGIVRDGGVEAPPPGARVTPLDGGRGGR